MPMEKVACSPFELPTLDVPEAERRRLPTMFDLPSDDPEGPGLPDMFHSHQPRLLDETFVTPDWPREQVFTAADLYLYYDRRHPKWYKRPDWFAVLGVPRFHPDDALRSSYAVWHERALPYVVVELLSKTDPEEDQGQPPASSTRLRPGQPPHKWTAYEQVLAVPFYLIYDRFEDELRCFALQRGRYHDVTTVDRRLWLPAADLGIGLWEGSYKGLTRKWLRCFDAAGKWIPNQEERELHEHRRAELASRHAERERQRAEQQSGRAELANRNAERERQRAEQQSERAEKLAAQLRACGVEPDA